MGPSKVPLRLPGNVSNSGARKACYYVLAGDLGAQGRKRQTCICLHSITPLAPCGEAIPPVSGAAIDAGLATRDDSFGSHGSKYSVQEAWGLSSGGRAKIRTGVRTEFALSAN